jgi:hypothetical protein
MKKKLQHKKHRKLRKCERGIKTKSVNAKYYGNQEKKYDPLEFVKALTLKDIQN